MTRDDDVTSKPQGFTVNDMRGKDRPGEVCRVCGAPEPHAKHYNQPTMECIVYLRAAVRDAVEAERERVKTALDTLFEHARVTHLGMLGDRPETTVAFFDGFRDGIYEARAAAARIREGGA